MKARYNELLNKLDRADEYFMTRYHNETPERQEKAMQGLHKLMDELSKLYKILRAEASTQALLTGFNDNFLDITFDIASEPVFKVVDEITSICGLKWELYGFEYLARSHKLIAQFRMKEVM